jgi:deoxyhypusine synthase
MKSTGIRKAPGRAGRTHVLASAFRRGVPVYVPAFTDSELGLDVATHSLALSIKKGDEADAQKFFSVVPPFNPFLDLYDYARRINQAKTLEFSLAGSST